MTIAGGHRVATFAVDKRDQRDAVMPVDNDVVHQSCLITAGECRKKSSTSRSYRYVGCLSPMVFARRSPRANASTVPALVY